MRLIARAHPGQDEVPSNRNPPVRSLFARLLLALAVSTILALVIHSVLTRVALQRGFVQFLERQEERHLSVLAPELAAWYRRQGSWEPLARDPRRWVRWLAQQRPEGVRPSDGEPAERRVPRGRRGDASGPEGQARHLWRRLFVLDADQRRIAGALYDGQGEARMEAIEVDGRTVGWVGFLPLAEVVSPEARQFLALQRRALFLALIVSLGVALVLGLRLARSMARPVDRVRESVAALTDGDFEARTGVRRSDELGDLARDVDRLADTLERNRTARQRWTADVAHELRTPVSILRGELEALRDGVRSWSPESLASLQEETVHLERLVEDLHTLALADAGALDFRFRTVDVAALVRQVVEGFDGRLGDAGLTLNSRLPDRLPLRADAQRMRQLLHNLLENACRYTAAGGTIAVTLQAEGQEAVLTIEDSAPGVAPAAREHLFERFYRAETSRSRARGGSGLGLAICQEIVAGHQGRIEAGESALGGLRVTVRLPRDERTGR